MTRPTHSALRTRHSTLERLFSGFHFGMGDFGMRRQSGSGDGAFGRTRHKLDAKDFRACKSGVALRLPPQSKTTSAFRMPQGNGARGSPCEMRRRQWMPWSRHYFTGRGARGWAKTENVNYAVKSSLLLSFLESVPAVSAKLKAPVAADRKFEDVVKSAQDAAVLVLVY